ncbi:cobaltochelatase subunit CobN [Methanococcoides sp. LMO-2]|uniref:Cobaltochelatase subunit CobN n=1 Tax=Methanococcoides cohabitans TaxID=3136559 RepID=A0ABU9KTS2_9EURY
MVSAEEPMVNITYVYYEESDALEMAELTNEYRQFIGYTAIPAFNESWYASDQLIEAADNGFLSSQDVILFEMVGSKVYNTVSDTTGLNINETLQAAHDNGTSLLSVKASTSTPSYFDHISNGSADDAVYNYYSNMGTEGEGLGNAEDLLICLAKDYGNDPTITRLLTPLRITYVYYQESDALETAKLTNDHSQFIEYNAIPAYNATWYASDQLVEAADNGLLASQDVILFEMVGSKVYNTTSDTTGFSINETLQAVHDNGTSLLSVKANTSTPSYFDHISNGSADDQVYNYYSNMDVTVEGIDSAEDLLIYLATEYSNHPIINFWDNVNVDYNEILFVLGTDYNEVSLINAAQDSNISTELNITIFTKNDTVPDDYDFSEFGLIFLESQDENSIANWTTSIKVSKELGSKVICYDLASNVSPSNLDLYSDEYTDIERYWVQGGQTNMENMLMFMGQQFADVWEHETIDEPQVLLPKVNITFILNAETNLYYLNQVLTDREVVAERFNVTLMNGEEATSVSDFSDQDVIILYMVGADQIPLFKDALIDAQNSGTEIGVFGMGELATGVGTIDMDSLPHSVMVDYFTNSGIVNMERWIRYIGSNFEDAYIEYGPVTEPPIPKNGIYHPDAFPRIFEDSTDYLEWYSNRIDGGHVYDSNAPTIGIVNYALQSNTLAFTADDALIRYIESKGCNVIYATGLAFMDDDDGNRAAEYYSKDEVVLVDSMISLKGFYINFDLVEGQEYLTGYNIPVVKGIYDYYQSPSEYYNSTHGLSPTSLYYQVAYPEIEGCTDYIWVAGIVKDPMTGQSYYEPIMEQVEWISDRAIAWAELGKTDNSDKKVSIIYYNHEGGKNNIGASYLDIGSSFTLLLEQMRADGYDIGNGTIPNASEFIDLFIESRNVGSWAPGELEKVVNSGNVTLVPVEDYLAWYNTLPESVRQDVESKWGTAPGDIMVYDGNFVIPTVQLGNVNFIPQPTRGTLSDESILYHDKELPPTHQYLATYFWINNVYDADAMIHFGTHGTQEWLPGKEVGLWRYDYPSIMVAETPVIYPYIMDNVGEGTQAKRRGNAVIIDHLTPPIVEAGLYGNLSIMHEKIHNYEDAKSINDTAKMALYRNSTIELYDSLCLVNDLNVTCDELNAMTDEEFETFLDSVLHDYLHKLQTTLMPYGLHIFGVAPENEKLVSMVKSMLRSDFIDHIYSVIPKDTGDEEDWENAANTCAADLLNATLINGTNVSAAQLEVLNLTDANVTADLDQALYYSGQLAQTTREIDQTLRALNAEYIEPGPGNDPIRNPEALPTGRNFYSFDQRKFPDAETEALGKVLIDQWVADYYAVNGVYPDKQAFILWSVETMRHKGLMEAQIYALIGVELERSSGRITGFNVIPEENMTHPRIDVLVLPSGLYRDTFPLQLEWMDEAVRIVADLNESEDFNFVRRNSLEMEAELIAMGYDNETAEYISRSRIFSEPPGSYGTGISETVAASDTWDDESKMADLYISRMSNIYGADSWGENYEDVFKMNLEDVDVAMHSDTSNLYGLIDNDDFYSYLGGLGLAVRSLTGETPDMYIADFKDVDNPQYTTLEEAFRNELRARYLNPSWMTGMMEFDYAGAREFMKFTEYMWGWDATCPDMVTDDDWNMMYEAYVLDKYDLGLDEFYAENPYQYQSQLARMLETTRKDYWDASDEVIQTLVREYIESVVENGVTCCHHTCGNALLDEYVQGIMSVPGVVDQATIDEYNKLMQDATHRYPETSSSSRKTSSNTPSANVVNSTTTSTDATGYGTTTDQATAASQDNYVEGYEMTRENTPDESSSSSSFSGSDVIGAVLVLLSAGLIYFGFMRKK